MASAITELPLYENSLSRGMSGLRVIVSTPSSSNKRGMISPTELTKEHTETPRKLKHNYSIRDNQPEEMELEERPNSNSSNQELDECPSGLRPYPPKNTIGRFSPRPKQRQQHPARQPVNSKSAIQTFRQGTGNEAGLKLTDNERCKPLVTAHSFRLENQSSLGGLDCIQESEESEDDDEFDGVYDGDDEISLHSSVFSKSYSGVDLLVRYDTPDSVCKPQTCCGQNHQDDEDMVCM